MLSYGSEFRSSSLLEKVFKFHPLWPQFKDILDNGVKFPLNPISSDIRKKDLLEALKFGNHKGVSKFRKIFDKLIKKDVIHGYALPIPLKKVTELENALMSPLNIAEQNTISELGEVIPSQRLTHNQSKEFSASGTSINGRVQKDSLQDCLYGHCLL